MQLLKILSVLLLAIPFCNAKTISQPIHYLDHFEFQGPGQVTIIQSDHNELILDGDETTLSNTKIDIGKGHLTVIRKKKIFRETSTEFTCKLFVKELSEISLVGNVLIQCDDLKVENLKMATKGAVQGNLGLHGDKIVTFIDGSGNLTFKGSVKSQILLMEGSGSYDAKNLQSESAEVKIMGSGEAHINANNTIAVAIIGSGQVYYSGSAEISQNILGSGKIVQE